MKHSFLLCLGKLLGLGLLLASGACRVMGPAGSMDDTTNYCIPPQRFGSGATADAPRAPLPAPPALDTTLLPQLSVRSQQLARAYGLTPALRQLVLHPAGNDSYKGFVRQRRALTLQVVQAAGDALRVVEELECEKRRVDQATAGLQSQQTKQTRNLTIGSLLAGATSGIVSATILNENKANLNLVLTVGTAALSAGLGVGTLFVNPQLAYPLPNNLLADVWYQRPQPVFYPPGLWATLSDVRSGRTDAGAWSPLQTIRQRWAKYDQLSGGKPAQQAQRQELYFGRGGRYHLDDLHVRSDMLGQVASAVRVVNQDLQKLLVEVSTVEPQ